MHSVLKAFTVLMKLLSLSQFYAPKSQSNLEFAQVTVPGIAKKRFKDLRIFDANYVLIWLYLRCLRNSLEVSSNCHPIRAKQISSKEMKPRDLCEN